MMLSFLGSVFATRAGSTRLASELDATEAVVVHELVGLRAEFGMKMQLN